MAVLKINLKRRCLTWNANRNGLARFNRTNHILHFTSEALGTLVRLKCTRFIQYCDFSDINGCDVTITHLAWRSACARLTSVVVDCVAVITLELAANQITADD